MGSLPSNKQRFYQALIFVLCVLFFGSTTTVKAQGVFGDGGSSGGGIFDGIVKNIQGIFDNFGVGVPGGAIIPGITPIPTPEDGGPVTGLPPAPNSAKQVKLALEWDALSLGVEAVDPSSTDPLETIHMNQLRCPPCPAVPTPVPEHKSTEWHLCAPQLSCVVGFPEHVLYGWCGQKPKLKNAGRVPSEVNAAFEGPNTYTLPYAVSNKYIRRDGYAFKCLRPCKGTMCEQENYMEFQTEVYPSNGISMYLTAYNPSGQAIDDVLIHVREVSDPENPNPMPHNVDYPISASEYVHGNNLDSFSATLNGIPVRTVDGELQVGPFYLGPGSSQQIPLQSTASEKTDIPGSAYDAANDPLNDFAEDSNDTDNLSMSWFDGLKSGFDSLINTLTVATTKSLVKTASAQCSGIDWGVNIDPANPGGIPSSAGLGGSGLLRIEFKDCTAGPLSQAAIDMYRDMLNNLQNGGNGINMILDYSSLANANDVIDANPDVRNAAIDAFVQRAVDVCESMGDLIDSYEIWNEPDLGNIDGQGKPILPPEIFGEIVRRTSDALAACDPSAKRISGGLASGNWGYLQGMGPLPGSLTSVGVHPYNKTVGGVDWGGQGDLAQFLQQGLGLTGGLPLSITEMGVNSPDGGQVALYMQRFAEVLNSQFCGSVDSVTWFSWSDAMVPNFGLVDAAGNPKPQFYAYFEQFLGIEPPDQISYLNPTTPQGNNCGGGGNPLPPTDVPGVPPGGPYPPAPDPDAPYTPGPPGDDVPYGSPVSPPDYTGKLGKGGIMLRDFNFNCEDGDDLDSSRCGGGDEEIIKPSDGDKFKKYRDTTGIGGCGYWASSNNSIVGPFEIVAEYGGDSPEDPLSRSVLLAAIPVGGRLNDAQSRPYGWPTSGEIEMDWGYSSIPLSNPLRGNPAFEGGDHRYCGS